MSFLEATNGYQPPYTSAPALKELDTIVNTQYMDYTDLDITDAVNLQNVILDILDGCNNTSDTVEVTTEMLELKARIERLFMVGNYKI